MDGRPKTTYSLRDVATLLQCDHRILTERVEASGGDLGPFRGICIAGRWRFPRRAVDAWLNGGSEALAISELLTAILTTLEAIYAELPSHDAQQVA